MKEARELLEKKQAHLEKLIDQEVVTAKKYAKSNKRLALNALKKKKKLENDLNRSDAVLSNIDLLLVSCASFLFSLLRCNPRIELKGIDVAFGELLNELFTGV